jgi:hypothetical protein
MASSSDIIRNINLPGTSEEMRDELVSAFDALSHWRDEIEGVNERCLAKVLVKTSAIARSMGWPDQVIEATREHLETASKMQTQMIDQMIDGWKRQLNSPTRPMALPGNFVGSNVLGNAVGTMPTFSPLTPWTLWLQAAAMWQRTWMPEMPTSKRPHS